MPGVLVVQAAAIITLYQLRVVVTHDGVFLDAHVLANEVALEQRDVTQHFFFTVGKLPVTDHDIESQDVGRLDHVHAAGPQCRTGPLPQVSPIQRERVLFTARLRAQHLEQGFYLREAPGHAVLFGRVVEIQVGIGIGLGRVRLEPHVIQQHLANKMWRPAESIANTDVYIGFTEIYRQQLAVNIGNVEDARSPLHRYIIEALGGPGGTEGLARNQGRYG